MKTKIFESISAGIVSIIFMISGCTANMDNSLTSQKPATDPQNAAYIIEDQMIRLVDGRSETSAAPGSATKIITSVLGRPVYGNIDGENGVDAVLFITQDLGGSGTFYYAAAALDQNGVFQGTHAVLLGDRVTPRNIEVHSGVVFADYVRRRPEEPMATTPSVDASKYLVLEGEVLKEVGPIPPGDEVLGGWVVIGHEVRSFSPCSGGKELWLGGDSAALGDIMAAYEKALPDPEPYAPMFMTLAGRTGPADTDGFGADYEASFRASQLIRAFQQGNCKSDSIYLKSPLPGDRITSPLTIRGYARGNWFFEGDFPVLLLDATGAVVARGFATSKSPWMTDMFVPFESVLQFDSHGPGGSGTLVLKKDNPTDNPEFDDEIAIPVYYK